MQKINKIFRSTYVGEEIRSTGLYINSEWVYQKEFLAKPFEITTSNNSAIVVGNGISRNGFDLSLIMPWREVTPWGERTNWNPSKRDKKFNTYGCNAIHRHYNPEFLIVTGNEIINEVVNDDYCDANVVYASKFHLMANPGKFLYIPQDPQWNAGALAAYMAAFDGFNKIFMLGFDGIDSNNTYNVYAGTNGYPSANTTMNEDYWVKSLLDVMQTYPDTEFIRVAPSAKFRTPELWKYCLNFRTIDFRRFALEADL